MNFVIYFYVHSNLFLFIYRFSLLHLCSIVNVRRDKMTIQVRSTEYDSAKQVMIQDREGKYFQCHRIEQILT